MSLTLVPMSDVEFDAYLQRMIPEYAQEGALATGMPADEALEFAHVQIQELLPEGRTTAGRHFRELVESDGTIVGVLWFAERPEEEPPDRSSIAPCVCDQRGRYPALRTPRL